MSMTIEDCNSNDNQNIQIKYKLENPTGKVIHFFRTTEKNRSCILRSWIVRMYQPQFLKSIGAEPEIIKEAYLESICFHQREIEKLRFEIVQPTPVTAAEVEKPEILAASQYFAFNCKNKSKEAK
jgi:hypothetical protein